MLLFLKRVPIGNRPFFHLWVFFLICFCFPFFSRGEEKKTAQPLFPVRMDHAFPQPEDTFEEIKTLVLNHYYSNDIDRQTLYWAAIQGILRHISPPENPGLSKIWTAEQYDNILNSLKGVKISLGFKSSFNPHDGSLTVTDVIPGSPSETVLKPYDRILCINSRLLKNKSLSELNLLLEGDEGEEATLKINRGIEIFDVTLKRKKFETTNMTVTPLTDQIALLEIKSFTAGISQKIKAALNDLRKDRVRAIIMDLRNNRGGVFMESLRVAELFLPEKKILLRTMQREKGLQNYVSSNTSPFSFDIAMLVNQQTASSAEILTSALHDNGKGLIIGTRTYGKGVFEKTFTLKNKFRIKFITGSMYSPKGKTWQSRGIKPDFLVEQDEKTLSALLKLKPKQRLLKDVAVITAYKLLNRSAVKREKQTAAGHQ